MMMNDGYDLEEQNLSPVSAIIYGLMNGCVKVHE